MIVATQRSQPRSQPRLGRIPGRSAFERLGRGYKVFVTPHFKLFVWPPTQGESQMLQLGVSVAKAIARRAVARNYMRRVMRELLRANMAQAPCCTLLMVARKAYTRGEWAQLNEEVRAALPQLQAWLASYKA